MCALWRRILLLCAKVLSARASPPLETASARAQIVREPDGKSLGALPTAMGGITRLACAQARRAGVDLEPLLKKAGLTGRQIQDHGVRIKVRQQIEFLNLVAGAVRDPFLGFHLALSDDLRWLGLLYYIVASSDTFGDALRRGARYTSAVNEGLSLRYEEGNDLRMVFDYVGVARHVDRHQIEFCFAGLVRVSRQLTDRELVPSRVSFTHHRAEDTSELSAFFGREVEFDGAADQLTFDASLRDLPILSADSYLNEILVAYAEEALARHASGRSSFQADVENAVVPLLPHGKARAAEVAKKLGVSRRTFARRLASEGLSFSDVLEGLRADLARQYLADEHLSISQVAWLLGYREISAFTHAFKRWTGMTPREARTVKVVPS
jgi:AraC-like DNA-binding protein